MAAKRCFRVRGIHDLEMRQQALSVSSSSHRWSTMRSRISGGKGHDMLVSGRVRQGVLRVVVPPKFDLLSAIDRPKVASMSKREITVFGCGPRHAVCKLVEIHLFLSFHTECAGPDIDGILSITVEGKGWRGVPPAY
jgi:hypothetical protein